MLTNKTKQSRGNVMIEDIKMGAFFGNNSNNNCDILILSDENGKLKMLNANTFFILNEDTSYNEKICEYLNKNSYYKLDAEIIICR